MWRFGLICIWALLSTADIGSAQETTAIVGGRVIDGNGGPPLDNGVVVFRGDRIVAVGPRNEAQIPPGARIIDASGKSVMPGLADMHVHLLGGWDGQRTDLLGYSRFMNALLYAGVTTVMDTGNFLPFVQQLRQEVAASRLVGPRIFMVGPLIDGPDPVWPPISLIVASTSQLPAYIRQLRSAGVDAVKAYAGLSENEIVALVRAANAESLRVFVDAGARNGTNVVAETGIAAFAHLGASPVSDEALKTMQDRGIASITTLAVYEAQSRRRLVDGAFLKEPLVADVMPSVFLDELSEYARKPLSADERIRADRNAGRLSVAKANAKRLQEAGVMLVAGTDAPYPGNYYGEGLHRELELLVEAGLTPLQALTASTKNAAILMNQAQEWGTLASGRRADILIINGHPASEIRDSRNVEMVIQNGRMIDRASLKVDRQKDAGFRMAPVYSPGQ